MKIEATATQVSDAINLATYKAGLVGNARRITSYVDLGGGKHIIRFANGDTLHVGLINGSYPSVQSMEGRPVGLNETAQAPLPIVDRPAPPYRAAPPPPPPPAEAQRK